MCHAFPLAKPLNPRRNSHVCVRAHQGALLAAAHEPPGPSKSASVHTTPLLPPRYVQKKLADQSTHRLHADLADPPALGISFVWADNTPPIPCTCTNAVGHDLSSQVLQLLCAGRRQRRHSSELLVQPMVQLTLIARVSDGLPLAEGLDGSAKDGEIDAYKAQAKASRAAGLRRAPCAAHCCLLSRGNLQRNPGPDPCGTAVPPARMHRACSRSFRSSPTARPRACRWSRASTRSTT